MRELEKEWAKEIGEEIYRQQEIKGRGIFKNAPSPTLDFGHLADSCYMCYTEHVINHQRGRGIMLYIYYGDKENVINRSDIYFNSTYQDEWLDDELVREMILYVDRSRVVSAHLIESPVLGPIGPKDLSGGTKTLILMYKDKEHIFNATNCGNNCAKWILEIAKRGDLTICLQHNLDFGPGYFEAVVLNTGQR